MTFIVTTSTPLLEPNDQSADLFPALSELTVAQAAVLLGVSEPIVDGLLVLGAIEYREDCGCRLIRRDNLIEYERDRKRMYIGLLEIVRLDQEMGLYDD